VQDILVNFANKTILLNVATRKKEKSTWRMLSGFVADQLSKKGEEDEVLVGNNLQEIFLKPIKKNS
jgi:hypothetical protein